MPKRKTAESLMIWHDWF